MLFGGGGSKSGLSGGGGSGNNGGGDAGEPTGYIFIVYKNGSHGGTYKWFEGKTQAEALRNATKYSNENGVAISNPLGKPMTREKAKQAITDRKNKKRN